MTKVIFEEVKLYGQKIIKCSGGCNRRLRRSRIFYQTINPFNKNLDGFVKSRDDIYKELKKAVLEWKHGHAPEFCIHCQ